MASLGELVARMSLDIGQFTGALSKAEAAAADATRKITKSINNVERSLAGMIAGVAGAHAVLEQFNKAVERGANLKEMSNAFGIGVEQLDKLSLAMQLAGTDAGTLEKQMKSLSTQIVEASNPASKAAKVFEAMGVELKDANGHMKSMDQIYIDAIRQLKAIEDPALRAAAANELFGKFSVAALKAAEELDASLAQAQKQTDAYGASSEETAAMSKQFGDSLLLIADGVQRMMLPVIKALLPVFEDFRKAMEEGAKGGVDLAAKIGGALATAFRTFGAGAISVVGILKEIGLAIGGTAAAIAVLFETRSFAAAGKVLDEMDKDMERNREATRQSAAAMLGYAGATDDAVVATERHAVSQDKLRNQLNGTRDAAKKASDELAKLAAKAAIKAIEDLANEYWNAIKAAGKFADDTRKSTADILDQANAVGKGRDALIDLQVITKKLAIDAMPALTEASKDALKALVDQEAAARKLFNANVALAEEKELRDALSDEVAVLGLLGVARDKALAQLRLQRVLTSDASDAEKEHAGNMAKLGIAMTDAHEATRLYSEGVKQWEDTLRTADDYGRTFFEAMGDGMKGVSDWAKKVGEDLKKWVLDTLYEMAKKWFINVVMNMSASGTVSGSGGGGMMGLGGGSGDMMSMISNIGGAAGYGAMGTAASAGLFSSLGGAGASQAAILAAQTAEFGAAGTGMTLSALGGAGSAAAGMGSIMTAMAPLMAAAPYIAAAVAVAMIVYQIVKSKEGGPKSGGFAQTGDDVTQRYFTPSNADAGLKKIVDTQQQGYDSLVKAMGGTSKASFAIGYDTDPMGKANNRVSSGVFVDGREVYGVHDRTVMDAKGTGSRDEKDLQNAINTEMKRSLLAALQNSELPAQLSRLLNSMTASGASDADIDNMLKMAQTVMAMNEALDTLADPMTAATDALKAAGMTALDAWEAQRDALYDLANEAPNTADGLNAVTAATGAFAQSTVNLLVGIENAKRALDDMFSSTRETIVTAGMSDQELYTREQKKADDLFKQLQTASDPGEIERIAKEINESINKAFGLLSPEEQVASRQKFLDGLDLVTKTTTERMDAASATVATQAQTDREFMSTKLDQILAGIEAAGNNFKSGVDALDDGIDVNIHVFDDRLTTEVTG
jgi:hypothetical protein